MNLCYDGHDEVCYEPEFCLGKECPVCAVLKQNTEILKEIEDLQKQLRETRQ